MPYTSLTPAQYAKQMNAAATLRSNPDATVGDLLRVADALGIPASDLMRMVEETR